MHLESRSSSLIFQASIPLAPFIRVRVQGLHLCIGFHPSTRQEGRESEALRQPTVHVGNRTRLPTHTSLTAPIYKPSHLPQPFFTMNEQAPRINAPLLERFQGRVVRIVGKVLELRGDTATIDSHGSITAYLDRVRFFPSAEALGCIC